MKKFFLALFVTLTFAASAAYAQNYMVVDSEKVFKSIEAYNTAMTSLDEMAKEYQKQIDDAFDQLETMYNNYQSQKNVMTASSRQAYEQKILDREKEINKFQEQIFGENGTMIQKRIETIKPFQDKVFNAITKYAEENGFDLVLDIASNPTVLYYKKSADKTDAIIALIK